MKKLLIVIYVFAFVACKTQQRISVVERRDTIYTSVTRFDSVYVRDSIVIDDSLSKTKFRYEYRYKVLRDTIWKVKEIDRIHTPQIQKKKDISDWLWLLFAGGIIIAIMLISVNLRR